MKTTIEKIMTLVRGKDKDYFEDSWLSIRIKTDLSDFQNIEKWEIVSYGYLGINSFYKHHDKQEDEIFVKLNPHPLMCYEELKGLLYDQSFMAKMEREPEGFK